MFDNRSLRSKIFIGISVPITIFQVIVILVLFDSRTEFFLERYQVESEAISEQFRAQLIEKIAIFESDTERSDIMDIFVDLRGEIDFPNWANLIEELEFTTFYDAGTKKVRIFDSTNANVAQSTTVFGDQPEALVYDSHIVISVPIAYDDRYYGSIVFFYSKDRIDQEHGELIRFTIAAVILSLLYCTMSAWFISSVLTKPINQLSEDSSIISAGDLDHTIRGGGTQDEVGVLALSVESMRDSIRKQVQQLEASRARVERSESRFRELTEMASDWVWETDANFRYLFFSREPESIGLEVKSVIGMTREELAAEPTDSPKWEAHRTLLRERKPFRNFQYKTISGANRELMVIVSGNPIFGDDGEFAGYRGTGTDITDRVAAEAARDHALHEAQLANQHKSHFLAAMSHELRTPLNAIVGFSEVITREQFGQLSIPKYHDYAKDIHESAIHLLSLINDLLDLSSVEAGRVVLQKEPVHFHSLFGECGRLVTGTSRSQSVVFRNTVDETLPSFNVDRRAIKQVILNLLSNAAKAMPQGGEIEVGVVPDDSAFRFFVRDTGVGMEKDKIAQLDRPWMSHNMNPFRADSGWGMGLAISRSLVELHSGKMVIESEPGAGTMVTVILPRQEEGG